MSFLVVAAILLLITQDWRLAIMGLAIQYFGVFVCVANNWPISLALVKLVAGLMVGAILATSLSSLLVTDPLPLVVEIYARPITKRTFLFFQLALVLLISLVVFSLTPGLVSYLPGISSLQAFAGLMLMGMGLLHLSLTTQMLRVILGLLTVLAGFEILYAVVESSTLLTGLLAGVNLGIGLLGSYLLTYHPQESNR